MCVQQNINFPTSILLLYLPPWVSSSTISILMYIYCLCTWCTISFLLHSYISITAAIIFFNRHYPSPLLLMLSYSWSYASVLMHVPHYPMPLLPFSMLYGIYLVYTMSQYLSYQTADTFLLIYLHIIFHFNCPTSTSPP